MLTQGWKLGCDSKQIWIFKEDACINFNIKIPTPKGALYPMYFKCNMETGLAAMSTGAKIPIMKALTYLDTVMKTRLARQHESTVGC
jgi:hypothetical protein